MNQCRGSRTVTEDLSTYFWKLIYLRIRWIIVQRVNDVRFVMTTEVATVPAVWKVPLNFAKNSAECFVKDFPQSIGCLVDWKELWRKPTKGHLSNDLNIQGVGRINSIERVYERAISQVVKLGSHLTRREIARERSISQDYDLRLRSFKQNTV